MLRLILAAATLLLPSAVFAGETEPAPLLLRHVLEINAALQASGCQAGVTIRDGSNEKEICKTFDYVTNPAKIPLARLIADNLAKASEEVAAYYKARNAFIAALDKEGGDRDKDGNLTQVATTRLAVWSDEYLWAPTHASFVHFKRSDLEAIGFKPPLLTALRPITDADNPDK